MRISGPAKQMVSRPKPIFLMLEKIEGRQNGLTLGFSTKCDFFQKFFQSKCHTLIFCRNKEFCEHRGFLRHLRFLQQNAIYGRIENIAKNVETISRIFSDTISVFLRCSVKKIHFRVPGVTSWINFLVMWLGCEFSFDESKIPTFFFELCDFCFGRILTWSKGFFFTFINVSGLKKAFGVRRKKLI